MGSERIPSILFFSYSQVPDTFGPNEVAKLRTLTSWSNYKQFFYLKSCLAIALENGFYECTHNPAFQPARHIIVDAGATHTTLFVVCYSKVALNERINRRAKSVSSMFAMFPAFAAGFSPRK